MAKGEATMLRGSECVELKANHWCARSVTCVEDGHGEPALTQSYTHTHTRSHTLTFSSGLRPSLHVTDRLTFNAYQYLPTPFIFNEKEKKIFFFSGWWNWRGYRETGPSMMGWFFSLDFFFVLSFYLPHLAIFFQFLFDFSRSWSPGVATTNPGKITRKKNEKKLWKNGVCALHFWWAMFLGRFLYFFPEA